MQILNTIKNIFTPKKPKIPVIKMYVLVRTDMTPINRAVQAGHAVAEYMKYFYNTTPWQNGYLIYLGVDNERELDRWETIIKSHQIHVAAFIEPDWGDPTKTAIAFCHTGEYVAKLPLLRLDDEVSKLVSEDLPIKDQ